MATITGAGFHGMLIALLSITSCADTPYTGSTLTPDDVERYIVSPDKETICLQNETDSACLKLTPKNRGGAANLNAPIIHIHPRKLIYVFYHDGRQILRAERAVDTSEIVEALTTDTRSDPPLSPGHTNPPVNTNPPPADTNPPVNTNLPPPADTNPQDDNLSPDDGWGIRINYPAPPEAFTLESSGLTIRINNEVVTSEGIRGFARVEGRDGPGIQFFYPTGITDSSSLTIEVTGLAPATGTVTFNMNSPVETSPDGITYQLGPL